MSDSVNILLGRKTGKIGELSLDAILREQHTYENEVTEYPVEEGYDISDNVKIKPDVVVITGHITNTPIFVTYEDINKIIDSEPGGSEVSTTERKGAISRVESAQNILLKISGRQIHGENTTPLVVDIVTGLRVHTNMLMFNLDIPRDNKTGQAMEFTASFKKFRVVTSETIVIASPQPAFKDKTQSKVPKGKQTPTDTKSETTKKVSSVKKAYNSAIRKLGV